MVKLSISVCLFACFAFISQVDPIYFGQENDALGLPHGVAASAGAPWCFLEFTYVSYGYFYGFARSF